MFGLIVMLSMTLSGHPSIINKINKNVAYEHTLKKPVSIAGTPKNW